MNQTLLSLHHTHLCKLSNLPPPPPSTLRQIKIFSVRALPVTGILVIFSLGIMKDSTFKIGKKTTLIEAASLPSVLG